MKKSKKKLTEKIHRAYWAKYDSLPDIQKAAIVIFIAIMLAYGAIILTGHSIVGTTVTGGVVPGGAYGYHATMPYGYYEVDPAADSVQCYQWNVLVGRQYLEGKIPLWNDHQGAGMPLMANFQSAAFFPFQILQDILPYYLWSLAYLGRLFFAGIFMYLFLTLLGFDFYGSITGAIFYILAGAITLVLRLDPYTNVAIMIPPVFWAIERASRSEAKLSINHILLSVFVAMTIAGGQPEMTTLVMISSLLYLLYKLWRGKNLENWRLLIKRLGLYCLAYGLGILLIMPLLIPGIEYMLNSYNTHGNLTGLAHNGYLAYITYVIPYIVGQVQQYWSPLLRNNFSWDGFSGYLGVVPVFLILLGLFMNNKRSSRGVIIFFAGLGLFLLLKTNGFPLVNMIGYLPILDRINFSRYAAPLVAFCFGVVFAYSVSNIDKILQSLSVSHYLYFLGGISVTFLIPLLSIIHQGNYNWYYLRFSYSYSLLIALTLLGVTYYALTIARQTDINLPALKRILLYIVTCELLIYVPYGFTDHIILLRTVIALLILIALVIIARRDVLLGKGRSIKKEAGLITTFFIINIAIFTFSIYGPPKVFDYFQLPPYMKNVANDVAENHCRIYGFGGFFKGESASATGLQDINVCDAMIPSDYANYVTRFLDRYVNPAWFDSDSGFRDNSGVTPQAELFKNIKFYDLLGVKYLLSQNELVPYLGSEINVVPGNVPLGFGPSDSMQESFISATDTLSALSVLTGTYDRINYGDINVYIKLEPNGSYLRKTVIHADAVENNHYTNVSFPEIDGVKGKKLYLELEYAANGPGPGIALWYNPNVHVAGTDLVVNGQSKQGAVGLAQYLPTMYLKEIYNAEGTHIYENTGVLPRAFFVDSIHEASSYNDALDFMQNNDLNYAAVAVTEGLQSVKYEPSPTDTVEIKSYDSDSVSLEATNAHKRLLLLTDCYYPGWVALVDGKESTIYRADGLFRGLVLPPGTHKILFSYRPQSFRLGVYLFSLTALILILELVIVFRRSRSRMLPQ